MNFMTYSSFNLFFVNNSNFTSVFSKVTCHANTGAERDFAGTKC